MSESEGRRSPRQRAAPRRTRAAATIGEVPRRRRSSTDDPAAGLLRAIESEIIPRLLLVHRSDGSGADAAAGGVMRRQDVEALASLVMSREPREAFHFVERVRADGASLEQIYLELLAPTAAYLGELWSADLCSFSDVTISLWRLQEVMHEFSAEFLSDPAYRLRGRRRALLVPAPGEQHTLGVQMVGEFLRRAGWEVSHDAPPTLEGLADAVSREWFAVVGLSISTESRFDVLAKAVSAARKRSTNRSVRVLVGGLPFVGHPELCDYVGADATADDSREAQRLAEQMYAAMSHAVAFEPPPRPRRT